MDGAPAQKDILGEILSQLEDEAFQKSLEKLINIIKNMENSGLLDFMETITDPVLINKIIELLAKNLAGKTIAFEKIFDQIELIIEELEAAEEPASLTQLLLQLKDPEVLKGLSRILKILKIVGSLNLEIQ